MRQLQLPPSVIVGITAVGIMSTFLMVYWPVTIILVVATRDSSFVELWDFRGSVTSWIGLGFSILLTILIWVVATIAIGERQDRQSAEDEQGAVENTHDRVHPIRPS